jgi:hypothetical protein
MISNGSTRFSQQILLFVVRRLSAEHVVMLLSVRDQRGDETAALNVPTLDLKGLSVDECRALMAALQVEVSPAMLEEIVKRTGGNPLAVIEAVRAVSPQGRRGGGVADRVWDLQYVTTLGQGRVWLENFDAARPFLGDVLKRARRAGAPQLVARVLGYRCELAWWTGEWVAAYADGAEALHWAEESPEPIVIGYTLCTLARLDAGRGNTAICRQRMDRALRNMGSCDLRVHIFRVLGLAALSAGDLGTAVYHLDHAWKTADDFVLDAPNVVPFAGDLIEAPIKAGDPDRAHEVLTWLEERARSTGLVYPAAAAARCRGLLADDLDAAERSFAEAKALHQQCSVPFERARTQAWPALPHRARPTVRPRPARAQSFAT